MLLTIKQTQDVNISDNMFVYPADVYNSCVMSRLLSSNTFALKTNIVFMAHNFQFEEVL